MYEDNNQLMNEVFNPSTIQELIDFVCHTTDIEYQNLIRSPRIVEILGDEVNFPHQTESLSRLAHVIEGLSTEESSSIRRRIGVIAFRVIANLISEVKYPYLAIKERLLGRKFLTSASFIMNFANRRKIRLLCSRLEL